MQVLEKPILPPPTKYLNSKIDSGGFKLYYFNPNSYGKTAFVIANSKRRAKEYLISTKHINPKNSSEEWDNDKIDIMVNLKDGYTLDEFNVGEVVFSEIA